MLTILSCRSYPLSSLRISKKYVLNEYQLIQLALVPSTLVAHYMASAGPPAPGANDYVAPKLRLVEEEGFEKARRTRNVIAHLRRAASKHTPLAIVLGNSGVAEEVRTHPFAKTSNSSTVPSIASCQPSLCLDAWSSGMPRLLHGVSDGLS